MYKVYVRQPWDTTWQVYNPRKSYLFKWMGEFKVRELKQSNWVTERTEFRVDRPSNVR